MSKIYYIYELVNKKNEVEYVGRTTDPHERLIEHRKKRGRFPKRYDLDMKIVKQFDTSYDASMYEGKLKVSYGMEWTERNASIRGGKTSGEIAKQSGQIYKLAKSNIENGTLERARNKSREVTKKKVVAYEYKTNKMIGKYDAMKDAADKLNVQISHISSICKGTLHQTKGYTFRYA